MQFSVLLIMDCCAIFGAKKNSCIHPIFPGFFLNKGVFSRPFFLPATEPAEERQRQAQNGERGPR